LKSHHDESFSIAKVAIAVGTSPMALYRHFTDVGELTDAILMTVLSGVGSADHRIGWRTCVRQWMDEVCERMLDMPQSVDMLASSHGMSPAWIRASLPLRGYFQAAGLSGRKVEEAVFWVTITVSGFAQRMLTSPLDEQLTGVLAAVERIESMESIDLGTLSSEAPYLLHNAKEIVFEKALDAIQASLPK